MGTGCGARRRSWRSIDSLNTPGNEGVSPSLGTRASRPRRGQDALAPLFPARQRNGACCCEDSQVEGKMPSRSQRLPVLLEAVGQADK